MKKALHFLAAKISGVSIVVILIALLSVAAYKNIADAEEENCWQVLSDSAEAINNEIQLQINDNIDILKLVSNAIDTRGACK